MQERNSPLGLGTAALGRPQYINIKPEKSTPVSLEAFRKKGWSVLDEAYKQGIRYFDTAPGYGLAEQLMIDWVKEKKDASIEVATKWGYTYVANFNPKALQHEIKELSVVKLNEQWNQSIQLLPNLTTYQIHSATLDTGVLENETVLNKLAELRSEYGIIIGITTSGANQIEIIKRAVEIEVGGNPLFDAFQVTYNILDQSLADIAEELKANHKRIIVKEALANGRLFPNSNYPHYQPLYASLNRIAEKHQVGIDAIALRFCTDTLHPFITLSGAENEEHLRQNFKAQDFILDDEDMMLLKEFKTAPEIYWKERSQLNWN